MTCPEKTDFSLGGLLNRVTRLLAEQQVDSPALSAQLLAGHVLDLDRGQVVLRSDRSLSRQEVEEIMGLVAERARGCPVAYLTGHKEFFGLDFQVNPAVLIPRPETEHLIEQALTMFRPDEAFRFADLGTGSGAIAVSLAWQRPRALGLATDISPAALALAAGNASRHGLRDRLVFVQADFASTLVKPASLDLILTNPPYISEQEYDHLDREVRLFEPKSALVPDAGLGGHSLDGLEAFRSILAVAKSMLRPGGFLLGEIGYAQGDAVGRLAHMAGFVAVEIIKDLSGHDRVLKINIS